MTSNISAHRTAANSPWLQRLGHVLLPVMGWQVTGLDLLTESKYVLVVAPHTSNWDLPVGLVCAHALGLFTHWPIRYMVKESATRWPLIGRMIRWFGGIPVKRGGAHDLVDQMALVFQACDRLLLAITPEGTRQRREYWKTGFYRIALKAQVPIALAYLDYKRRQVGIGQIIHPSGDMEADFVSLRNFYAGITAKFPHEVGPVDFKREG